MSTNAIAVFTGADSTPGDVVIGGGGAPISGLVAGDRIVQLLSIAGPYIGRDWSNAFDTLVPANGVLVQKGGQDLSAYVLLVLISRG